MNIERLDEFMENIEFRNPSTGNNSSVSDSESSYVYKPKPKPKHKWANAKEFNEKIAARLHTTAISSIADTN